MLWQAQAASNYTSPQKHEEFSREHCQITCERTCLLVAQDAKAAPGIVCEQYALWTKMCVHFMPNEDDVTDFSTPSEIVFIVLMLFVIFGFVVVCAIEHVIVVAVYI